MNVNELLEQSIKLLGIQDLTVSAQNTDPRLACLVNALAVCYLRLITEYAPLEREESVTVSGGTFDTSTLTEPFFDAVKLADEKGESAKFRLRGKYIVAEDGTYLLRYDTLPQSYPAIGGTIEVAPQITLPLLARGVAAEYALASMMYEESILHERKYKEGLMKVLTPHAAKHVTVKRWI